MYGSGTAQGLFSFTRLNALFFSVWASLSSGSNYVCQSFLPCFVLLLSPFLHMQVVGGEFSEPTKQCRERSISHSPLERARSSSGVIYSHPHAILPDRVLMAAASVSSLFAIGPIFVASTYLTRVVSSIPSAIRHASPSLTYQAKRVRRCWEQYAISLLLLRIL